jgi:pimeloyl-ACP methyl ester carboxylesterase
MSARIFNERSDEPPAIDTLPPELPADRPRWWGRPLAETRWLLELMRLGVDPLFLGGPALPRGDGRPVLLMPGLLAGDQTLAVLAGWLWRVGYTPRVCGFIANVDCSEHALDRVERKVDGMHTRSGRRVALIGHSRGGHFARALAARRPELVSHAISLGADLNRMFGVSDPTLWAIAFTRRALGATGRGRQDRCFTRDCDCRFTHDYAAPFPSDRVRLTSIYSRGDGVVCWHGCLVPYADCVEVTGSHTGLIFNRKAYRAIATALATPELSPSWAAET